MLWKWSRDSSRDEWKEKKKQQQQTNAHCLFGNLVAAFLFKFGCLLCGPSATAAATRLSPFHVYTSQCLVDFLPMNIDKAVARKNNGEGWGGWWGGTDGQRKGKFQGTSRRSFNGLFKNFALCSLIKLIRNELHLILGTKNIFCSKHNYNIFLLHASIINNNASSLEDIHIVYCTYPTVKST